MDKNKVIKSVSFNQKNGNDELILKYVKRRNFSGYVKKLILADINKNQKSENHEPAEQKREIPQPKKLTPSEKLEIKKKELKKRPSDGRPFIPR